MITLPHSEKLLPDLREFSRFYKDRPIKNNHGGGHSPHYFWLWWTIKQLKPVSTIESGVWKGQGSWIIEQTDSDYMGFDIDLGLREYEVCSGVYDHKDFADMEWRIEATSLLFLDDHVNHFDRIRQAKELGFKHLIFDDNYPSSVGNERMEKEMNNMQTLKQQHQPAAETSPNYQYLEFPPIYAPNITRWGDAWSNYNFKEPLFSSLQKGTECFMQEAKEYTSICYVLLD